MSQYHGKKAAIRITGDRLGVEISFKKLNTEQIEQLEDCEETGNPDEINEFVIKILQEEQFISGDDTCEARVLIASTTSADFIASQIRSRVPNIKTVNSAIDLTRATTDSKRSFEDRFDALIIDPQLDDGKDGGVIMFHYWRKTDQDTPVIIMMRESTHLNSEDFDEKVHFVKMDQNMDDELLKMIKQITT